MKGNENTARRSHPNLPPYGKGLTVSREVSPIQANPHFKDFVPLARMSENPASRNVFFSSFPIWGWPPLAARRSENVAHAESVSSMLGSRNEDETNISRLATMPLGLKTRFTSASVACVS